MSLLSLLIPLDLWGDIGAFFDKMMTPLYWVISGILVGAHWLWSMILPANAGITWALSIMTLTAVVRTAMIPLFVKTIQSSRNMQIIQPKLQELQKKYGADRQKLGEETMKLYRQEGINPMASCLPLVIQMPIFLSLYYVLAGAAQFGNPHPNMTPKGAWLVEHPELLESLANAKLFGARLSGAFMPMDGFGATQILAVVLILLMTALLFVTQREMMNKNMTPEAMTGQFAQTQKIMLYGFPIMYLFMGVMIPIGVLVYWTFSNLWTLVQQWLLIRNSPAPNTPAYIDWEERMKAKGLDPREIERARAEKRAGKRKNVATTTSASGVTRQSRRAAQESAAGTGGVARQKSAPVEADVAEDVQDDVEPSVTRQQPKRQTRAVRRKK